MARINYKNRTEEEQLNLREELEKFLKYWPWFVMGVLFSVALAFTYLKIATPVYKTSASIIIKDEKTKSPSSEMAAFADLGFLGGMGTNSIENEIGILRSKRMMTDVVKALNLNITYYDQDAVKNSELYQKSPYLVQILTKNEELLSEYSQESANNFRIVKNTDGIKLVNTETEEKYIGKLGEPVSLPFAEVMVVENPNYELDSLNRIKNVVVKFSDMNLLVSDYRERLQIKLIDENSSLVELGFDDSVKAKAQDILDQLILAYNQEAIEDKNLVARNTAIFIDERLQIITQELDSVETGKENFKEENKLTNIQAESEMFIENVTDYNNRKQELETQLELVNTMISFLNSDSKSDLLPANLGFQEQSINISIEEYNNLVLERNRILSGSTAKNPIVIRLDSQIEQMRENVLTGFQRLKSNLKVSLQYIDKQGAVINSKIAAVPAKERQYRGIERQQNIKESLYLFLLQKREENSLSLAVTAPKAKIVDRAYSSVRPISPKPGVIVLGSIFVGLIIPFLIIYITNLLNNKIKSREDLENHIREIPIVGEIPRIEKKDGEMVTKNDRSVLAESFRILHTNLQYLISDSKKERGITIFTTSTVKGEGKTLVSFNLAVTLANTNKKVLLVGADLRNPQLQRFEVDAREQIGVSDYLANDDLILSELIRKSNTDNPNLQLLPSGTIPPNPSELWRRSKTGEMFKKLEEQFDYVIVDTAPSLLVTDTFLISKYADLTLYVTRAGYTENKLLQFAVDSNDNGKFNNLSFVLNDVKLANFGYGNKYGYTYGEEKKSFLKWLTNKAAIF